MQQEDIQYPGDVFLDDEEQILPEARDIVQFTWQDKIRHRYRKQFLEVSHAYIGATINEELLNWGTITNLPYNKRKVNLGTIPIESCLCLWSNCKTGKTKLITELIKSLPPTYTILTVTFRQSLADKQKTDWPGFADYRDHKFSEDEVHHNIPRLICQVDSLRHFYGKYDLVILDELSYTIGHTISFTKFKSHAWKRLGDFIENAIHVIAMDATFDNMCYEYLVDCKREPFVVRNTYKSLSDTTVDIINSRSKLEGNIKADLELGKKLFVVTNIADWARDLYNVLTSQLPGKRILLVTQGMPILLDKWKEYDGVIISPAVTAGLSFEEDHFDCVYGHFRHHIGTARDWLQMLLRVRSVKDKKMYINVEKSRAPCKTIPKNHRESYTAVKTWMTNRKKELASFEFVRDLFPVQQDKNGKMTRPGYNEHQRMLERHFVTGEVLQNSYFKALIHYTYLKNQTRCWPLQTLLGYLALHGAKLGKIDGITEAELAQSENIEMKTMMDHARKVQSDLDVKLIISAPIVAVLDPKVEYPDPVKMKRNLVFRHGIPERALTPEIVRKYSRRLHTKIRIDDMAPMLEMTTQKEKDDFIGTTVARLLKCDTTSPVDNVVNDKKKHELGLRYWISHGILKAYGFSSLFESLMIRVHPNFEAILMWWTQRDIQTRVQLIESRNDPVLTPETPSWSTKLLDETNRFLLATWGVSVRHSNNKPNSPFKLTGMWNLWKKEERVNNGKREWKIVANVDIPPLPQPPTGRVTLNIVRAHETLANIIADTTTAIPARKPKPLTDEQKAERKTRLEEFNRVRERQMEVQRRLAEEIRIRNLQSPEQTHVFIPNDVPPEPPIYPKAWVLTPRPDRQHRDFCGLTPIPHPVVKLNILPPQ